MKEERGKRKGERSKKKVEGSRVLTSFKVFVEVKRERMRWSTYRLLLSIACLSKSAAACGLTP